MLPAICNGTNLKSRLLASKCNFIKPIAFLIWLLLFVLNFDNNLSEIDVDHSLTDLTTLPLSCDKSPFVDKNHGHILTGYLRITKNN